MGGAWVFPGGAVHAEDADHAAAAVRELAGGGRRGAAAADAPGRPLVALDHAGRGMVRFDTWFFVAEAPPGAEADASTAASASTPAGCGPPPRSRRTSATS